MPTPTGTPGSAQTIEVRVATGQDDAEENANNGYVDFDSSDLELTEGDGRNQLVGIRFSNLAIPQGAVINTAYIEFETDETGSGSTSLTFHGQDADNAAQFTTAYYDISSRPTTSSDVVWNSVPAWNLVNEKHQSPNLAGIVQKIVNRGGWNSGNGMVFIITGSGTRTAESYDGETGAAPLLHIEYTDGPLPTPTPTGTPAPAQTVERSVATGQDDAEENANSGFVDFYSTDLELTEGDGHNQVVGMRFLNLTIPQGATVTNAYLEFETDETNSGTTSLTFHGQDLDDATAFTTAVYDISNRTTTGSSIAWGNVPAWNTVNEKHQTPNLAVIVQEIVNRGGWSSGNEMVFIITGSGTRTAESYDGETAVAPLLHIEYTTD